MLQTQKKSLLTKIKKILDEERSDWWDNLSIEEQQDIKTGLKQADNNEFIDNSSVLKRFDKWH